MDIHSLSILLLQAVATFVAMANPLANAPVFLSLTAGDDRDTQRAVARRATLVAFMVVVVFALLGKLIEAFFGFGMPAFRIAAGIIVFAVGYKMLSGESHGAQIDTGNHSHPSLEVELDKAISPLALPIMAGGGTLSAAMELSTRGIAGVVAVIVAFGLVMIASYYVFIAGESVLEKVGRGVLNAISRVMGLILAAIGVQIFLDGAAGALAVMNATAG